MDSATLESVASEKQSRLCWKAHRWRRKAAAEFLQDSQKAYPSTKSICRHSFGGPFCHGGPLSCVQRKDFCLIGTSCREIEKPKWRMVDHLGLDFHNGFSSGHWLLYLRHHGWLCLRLSRRVRMAKWNSVSVPSLHWFRHELTNLPAGSLSPLPPF